MPEYIVVTILVAASGKLDLPKITNQQSLVTALNKLAAIRKDQVRLRCVVPSFNCCFCGSVM